MKIIMMKKKIIIIEGEGAEEVEGEEVAEEEVYKNQKKMKLKIPKGWILVIISIIDINQYLLIKGKKMKNTENKMIITKKEIEIIIEVVLEEDEEDTEAEVENLM
jgi:hypothetical protein